MNIPPTLRWGAGRFVTGTTLFIALLMSQLTNAKATDISTVVNYASTVTFKAPSVGINLKAEVNYDNTGANMPIMVFMHQYSANSGNFDDYRANAQRLRDQGFFVISVAMRGREGSEGTRDSGGIEIYDIYDAVEAVKANPAYAGLIDKSNVSIMGLSGGGGNVMSAITKFPDYFRAAASYFGMSDYGYDGTDSWYFNPGLSGDRAVMNVDIGNRLTGGNSVLDKYMARDSALASMNNPYTNIHLFVNANEPRCPVINDTNFKDFAVQNATSAGEFDNIHVHIGASNLYYDFNGNNINDPNELQYWIHSALTDDSQHAGNEWITPGLLDGSTPQPVLNNDDILFVAGFVKTKKFEAWLGDGENAAGLLEYHLDANSYEFLLEILSTDKTKTGWVNIDLSAHLGETMALYRNGALEMNFVAGNTLRVNNFADGDTLFIQAVPEPALAAELACGGTLLALAARRRSK